MPVPVSFLYRVHNENNLALQATARYTRRGTLDARADFFGSNGRRGSLEAVPVSLFWNFPQKRTGWDSWLLYVSSRVSLVASG